jgi:SAM-dependent methyltransferase
MGIKLSRNKPRNFLLTVIYRIQKMMPLSAARKFKIFLNLEWIFDRLSHETSFKYYDPQKHPIRQRARTFILDNISETDRVLDLGCNLGEITFMIAGKAKEVVGIDFSKAAIDTAKKNFQKPNLIFLHREALEYLKEGNKHFDVLILSHILEHLDNPKEFLLQFRDYFKSVYIELPDFERSYLNQYRQQLNLDLIYSDGDHISEFDRDELKTLLKECGMEITKEEYRFGMIRIWCTTGSQSAANG